MPIRQNLVRTASALAVAFALSHRALAQQSAPATYHLEGTDPPTLPKRYTAEQIGLLEKLNRRDREHLIRLEQVIVPDAWLDELAYSPMPAEWKWAESQPKALVVDQPSQLFAAYEAGRLVRWGPVSSGRKETPTPSGTFHLTWRARSRRSTDNAQWLLNWYFNFINERGVSFHEFELPGVAASHACVRLLARDAQWIYNWGQEWTLSADKRTVATEGTPVVVLGAYDFSKPAPWLSLDWWKTKVELPETSQKFEAKSQK